jgi:hypothetical protein
MAHIINVKDYGALGNGSGNDGPAIQLAIDAAFGTAGSPHGTNAYLNKPLFFPNGRYMVSTPLVLTQVKGAKIYGVGSSSSLVVASGTTSALVTDGLEDCSFENIGFLGGTGEPAVDIDWDRTGSVELRGNIFTNAQLSSRGGETASCGCRIGFKGNGGSGNHFFSCAFQNVDVGLCAYGAEAIGNTVQGGSSSHNDTAFWAKDGQISSINDVGLAGNSVNDILVDSAFPILVKGCRTESPLFFKSNHVNGVAKIDACAASDTGVEFCHAKGRAVLDSCLCYNSAHRLCTDAAYTGAVYLRGNLLTVNFLSGYSGTTPQNI